jgi:hypothetical protein
VHHGDRECGQDHPPQHLQAAACECRDCPCCLQVVIVNCYTSKRWNSCTLCTE